MKKIILSTSLLFAFTSLSAEGIADQIADVLKTKIEADAKVAIENKASVDVTGSVLSSTTKMGNDNVVVGNTGIVAIGEEVKIDGSLIQTETEMGNDNVVVGNTGVVLGAH